MNQDMLTLNFCCRPIDAICFLSYEFYLNPNSILAPDSSNHSATYFTLPPWSDSLLCIAVCHAICGSTCFGILPSGAPLGFVTGSSQSGSISGRLLWRLRMTRHPGGKRRAGRQQRKRGLALIPGGGASLTFRKHAWSMKYRSSLKAGPEGMACWPAFTG